MRLFVASLVLVAAACAQPAVAADTNKEKIVGKWKMVKGEGVPAGTVIEFTKDGKVSVTVDVGGKSMTIEIGTYSVEGDKVTLKTKIGEKEDTEVNDIKTLTADKLILVDPKKKEAELGRVK
jgi:uncharacterized protein (TIGR03066 family)